MRVGPKYKICRRLGDPVFGKCQTGKFAVSEQKKRSTKRRRPPSEYGLQLLEKQKIRYTYGLTERMLSNYVIKSHLKKGTNPANALYTLLESRLDNAVHRLGFANSRAFARQLVSHGHIFINGKHVTIPSATVKKGDVISIRPQSIAKPVFSNIVEKLKDYKQPSWLALDISKHQGTVLESPEVVQGESSINLNEIIGFYSRV